MKGFEQPSSEANTNEEFGVEHFQQPETSETKKDKKGSTTGRREKTAEIYSSSAKAAQEAFSENAAFVMTMAESDELESAKEILMQSAVEKVRKELGDLESFNKLYDNDQVNQLFTNIDAGIQKVVRAELIKMLNAELGKAGEDEKKKENLQKLILTIGPADKTLN